MKQTLLFCDSCEKKILGTSFVITNLAAKWWDGRELVQNKELHFCSLKCYVNKLDSLIASLGVIKERTGIV